MIDRSKTGAYVAFLRAVNVGGRNTLPMADLSAFFTNAGCLDVRTYIQSGNVIFKGSRACAAGVPDSVARAIAKRFGFSPTVVLRSAAELGKVIADNPFLRRKEAAGSLHVGFLAERPARQTLAALDPGRSPGDSFVVLGREVYLCLPGGVGRTKLTTAYFEAKLAATMTVRNWRTIAKLHEMAGAS